MENFLPETIPIKCSYPCGCDSSSGLLGERKRQNGLIVRKTWKLLVEVKIDN